MHSTKQAAQASKLRHSGEAVAKSVTQNREVKATVPALSAAIVAAAAAAIVATADAVAPCNHHGHNVPERTVSVTPCKVKHICG